MGCCASRTTTSSEHDHAAQPPIANHAGGDIPNSSRAAINQPSASASTSGPTSRRPSSHSQGRPNAPIRPPSPLPTSPTSPTTGKTTPWTRAQLDAEREAFFDTRVTGSAEAWSALKLVCECLRRGETAQAQGILDAVGLNVPDGRVAVGSEARRSGRMKRTGGVFDERGVGYDIPGWVVADPGDVVEADGGGEKGEEEKGKGKAGDLGQVVTLKARLSDRSMDVVVQIGMGQTAAVVCEEVLRRIGPRKIRLMYLGQVWSESKTLEELGYKEGDVQDSHAWHDSDYMPRFLVPRHVSAHRISAIALYRALLQQSRAVPLPAQSQNALQNIVRNRFKQVIHLHSYQRLKLAFQAGYEAVDHLDAAVAGDEKSTSYIAQLLAMAPAKVKADPPAALPPKSRKKEGNHGESESTATPVSSTQPFRPSTELLSRPHPLCELSGKRHIPVLFNANNIPVLRIKKPQPENLSGFLKSRIKQRQRRHNRRHWLAEQIEFAQYEDLWDEIVERQTGKRDGRQGRNRNGEEPTWAEEFEISKEEVEHLIALEQRKNAEMAVRMQEIVDRETELFERERAERKERKRLERVEKWKASGNARAEDVD